MTWIILKVKSIPTHCGVAYESVHTPATGHVMRVWSFTDYCMQLPQGYL